MCKLRNEREMLVLQFFREVHREQWIFHLPLSSNQSAKLLHSVQIKAQEELNAEL